MPYYDYQCPDCGPFDQRRPLQDSALPANCPKCGKTAPRLLSAPYVATGGPQAGGSCGSGCGHSHHG